MSTGFSYKGQSLGSSLYSQSTSMAYTHRGPPKRNAPHNYQNASGISARSSRSVRSVRSVRSIRSCRSVFDALSIIDTYMCDASILDMPLEDENPFEPLPDIKMEKYQSAIESDLQSISKRSLLSRSQLRKSLILKVFLEDEILRLGSMMEEMVPEDQSESWECPTRVSGTPELDLDMTSFINFGDIGETTPTQSDEEYDFQLPIGVDSTRSSPKTYLAPSSTSSSTLDPRNLKLSLVIDRHLSETTINIDIKQEECIVMKRIRKIRYKTSFSSLERALLKQSWKAIFDINQPNDVPIRKETSSHRQSDNLCAYLFTKQFYNNLLAQVPEARDLFPSQPTKQIVYLGNILSETTGHLDSLGLVYQYLKRNKYTNRELASGRVSKTIFSPNSIPIERNEHYFAQFGRVFLKTINENFPGDFSNELEAAWNKYYQFLFSCVVGGFTSEEIKEFSKETPKSKSRASSATGNIDRHGSRDLRKLVVLEPKEECDSIVTVQEVPLVHPRPVNPLAESPLSISAFRTLPEIPVAAPAEKTPFFQRFKKEPVSHVTNGKRIKKYSGDDLTLLNKLKLLTSTFSLFLRRRSESSSSGPKYSASAPCTPKRQFDGSFEDLTTITTAGLAHDNQRKTPTALSSHRTDLKGGHFYSRSATSTPLRGTLVKGTPHLKTIFV